MRKIFSLPNTAHRWLLCPLMGQYHIKYQLYMKDIKLLYNMNMFVNNYTGAKLWVCDILCSYIQWCNKSTVHNINWKISIIKI